MGAGLVSISGPAAVWQLVGFLVVGVAVGYGCLAAVPGSLVIEWAPVGPPGGLWRHREWEVEDRRPAVVADQVRIESVGGQGRIVPSGGGGAVVTLRDQVIRTATPLQPGDRVRIGEQEYLVRRTGGIE